MDAIKTSELAHSLYRAHGDRAEAEAAQRERHFSGKGDVDLAAQWRAVRQNIRHLRGANQS